MALPLLFDAVLFDLDGTLVATDRFWIQAARVGARRAVEALGLHLDLPGPEAWMQLVGHPLAEGFARLFPGLSQAERDAIQAACEREEHRLLQAGAEALMPGAREVLSSLSEAGVQLGVASNCSQEYLDHWIERRGLGRWVPEARCLQSPGIRSKADMIADLLDTFQTRSAVFVGDRVTDRDAAWENGIPHVHCAFGFAARGEEVAAEAVLTDLGELLQVLRCRASALDDACEAAGLLRPQVAPPLVLGVGGPAGSGRTLLARDLARRLGDHGFGAAVVPLAAFALPGAEPELAPDARAALDLERLERDLLEPYRRGEPVLVPVPTREPREPWPPEVGVGPDDVLVLEGPWLLDPSLRSRVDRVIWLTARPDALLRRLAGRDARRLGPDALEPAREAWRRAALHGGRYRPEELADVCLEVTNPLAPRVLPVGAGALDPAAGGEELPRGA